MYEMFMKTSQHTNVAESVQKLLTHLIRYLIQKLTWIWHKKGLQ